MNIPYAFLMPNLCPLRKNRISKIVASPFCGRVGKSARKHTEKCDDMCCKTLGKNTRKTSLIIFWGGKKYGKQATQRLMTFLWQAYVYLCVSYARMPLLLPALGLFMTCCEPARTKCNSKHQKGYAWRGPRGGI